MQGCYSDWLVGWWVGCWWDTERVVMVMMVVKVQVHGDFCETRQKLKPH